jgi:hypothetical protein
VLIIQILLKIGKEHTFIIYKSEMKGDGMEEVKERMKIISTESRNDLSSFNRQKSRRKRKESKEYMMRKREIPTNDDYWHVQSYFL